MQKTLKMSHVCVSFMIFNERLIKISVQSARPPRKQLLKLSYEDQAQGTQGTKTK